MPFAEKGDDVGAARALIDSDDGSAVESGTRGRLEDNARGNFLPLLKACQKGRAAVVAPLYVACKNTRGS